MPVTVGGKKANADPAKQLLALADLWVEATELGRDLRATEEKVRRQAAWLDANRGHELYGKRVLRSWETRKEQERLTRRLHEIAGNANTLAEQMDRETRRRATAEIHEWAALGSVGIYSQAWSLVPSDEWLKEIEE